VRALESVVAAVVIVAALAVSWVLTFFSIRHFKRKEQQWLDDSRWR
jgi:hypothetical protein